MLFNSIDFLVFFAVVAISYFLLPYNKRTLLLLAGSCFFYMFFKPAYILILALTIVLDYYLGIAIENARIKRRRKLLLIIALVANVAVLAVFKYYNFINANISVVLEAAGLQNPAPYLQMILPIGLSFHTFQAISYIIEVYRDKQKAERNFSVYSLYVMFFPQLVAGPIERPQNLLHQFYERHKPNPVSMKRGLQLMLWGFFKKIVIADRLAYFVDIVYNDPRNFHGPIVIAATIFFAFQIYCDFSGYSDIAIGAASVLGFRLMRNFDRPYLSASIIEFWRRWHISLSTWFRDYVYFPLGGNRGTMVRNMMNILVVFVLSGIWHGANWTFAMWGLLNGMLLCLNHLANKVLHTKGIFLSYIGVTVTFAATAFCWIFFRANNMSDAWQVLNNSFTGFDLLLLTKEYVTNFNGMNTQIMLAISAIIFLISFEYKQDVLLKWYRGLSGYGKLLICYSLVMAIIVFGFYKEETRFIYFQF